MAPEVGPAGLGGNEVSSVVDDGGTADLVGVALTLASDVGTDILISLEDIASDIEGVAGSLGDSETVVERDTRGDGTEADHNTPHLVNSELADTGALANGAGGLEGLLEASSHDQRDDGSRKLTEPLHGEDGTHHGTTPLGRSEPRDKI